MNRFGRAVVTCIAAAAAGFMSGIMYPALFGVRGAILGFTLAAAVYATDAIVPRCRPGRRSAGSLAVALAAALIASTAMRIAAPYPIGDSDEWMTRTDAVSGFLICAAYAIPLLRFACGRRGAPGFRGQVLVAGGIGIEDAAEGGSVPARRSRGWVVAAVVAPPLLRAPPGDGFLLVAAGAALLGSLPFVALWLVAVSYAAPAPPTPDPER